MIVRTAVAGSVPTGPGFAGDCVAGEGPRREWCDSDCNVRDADWKLPPRVNAHSLLHQRRLALSHTLCSLSRSRRHVDALKFGYGETEAISSSNGIVVERDHRMGHAQKFRGLVAGSKSGVRLPRALSATSSLESRGIWPLFRCMTSQSTSSSTSQSLIYVCLLCRSSSSSSSSSCWRRSSEGGLGRTRATGRVVADVSRVQCASSSVGMEPALEGESEGSMPPGRFAVLVTGYASEYTTAKYGGGYERLFIDMLSEPGELWDVYHVVDGEFPSEQKMNSYNGFIVTGSKYDAHGLDPWIERLIDMVSKLNDKRQKMLGVCFGHQLLGRALGGKTGRAEVGWELGLREVSLYEENFEGKSYTAGVPRVLRVYEVHRDQVLAVPPGGQLLGSSSRTPVEVFSVGDHVLGIQGHPEFTKDILEDLIASRLQLGIITGEEAKMARDSMDAFEPDTKAWVQLCKAFLKGSDSSVGPHKTESDLKVVHEETETNIDRRDSTDDHAAPTLSGNGSGADPSVMEKLEAYTEKVTSEVLRVHAEVDGSEDEVIVFRGYSSSLTRPTSADPSDPILPRTAVIKSIDRIKAPYNPSKLLYIQKDINLDQFLKIMKERGI